MNRRDVYNKYDGHCAYCGKKIEFDDMTSSSLDFGADWFLLCQNHYSQVGSSSPHKLKFAGTPMGKPSSKGGANTLENTIPSCQLCNNQKADRSIEEFRSFIENITETLDEDKQYRLAWSSPVRFSPSVGVTSGAHYRSAIRGTSSWYKKVAPVKPAPVKFYFEK